MMADQRRTGPHAAQRDRHPHGAALTMPRDVLHDLVTTPARRGEYLRLGHWDDRTLAGQVRRHAATRPDRPAVIDDADRIHTYRDLASDAGRVAAQLAARAWRPATSCPSSSRTGTRPSSSRSPSRPWAPSSTRCCPTTDVGSCTHVFTTARPAAIVTPTEYRGFDHVALVDEVVAATGVAPHHVARRPERFPRRDPGGAPQRARHAARPRPERRGGVRAHLHVGDRGQPEGDHAHRADGQLQRARRLPRSRPDRRRRRVDAVARRPLHRLQLRAALRALPRAAARAAGPVGRRRGDPSRPRPSRHLHPGRHHVPPGPRRGGRPVPRAAPRAALLRLRRRARPAGPRPRRRRRRHQRPAPLRLHRGARRDVEPARQPSPATHGHRRRGDERRRGRDPTTTMGRPPPRANPARSTCAVRTPASGSSATPSGRPPPSTTPAGCAAATSGCSTAPASDGQRTQEGDHHPRGRQHRAPRDRGAARRLARGRAGRRRRPPRSPPRASGAAPAWSCAPARR